MQLLQHSLVIIPIQLRRQSSNARSGDPLPAAERLERAQSQRSAPTIGQYVLHGQVAAAFREHLHASLVVRASSQQDHPRP